MRANKLLAEHSGSSLSNSARGSVTSISSAPDNVRSRRSSFRPSIIAKRREIEADVVEFLDEKLQDTCLDSVRQLTASSCLETNWIIGLG